MSIVAIGIKSTPESLAASYSARTGVPVSPELVSEFAVAMALAPIAAAA